jgi:hypothetical protein
LAAEYAVDRTSVTAPGFLLLKFLEGRTEPYLLYDLLFDAGCIERPRETLSIGVEEPWDPADLWRALRSFIVEFLGCDFSFSAGRHVELFPDVLDFISWLHESAYLDQDAADELAWFVKSLQGRRARAARAARLMRGPLRHYERLMSWYNQFLERNDFWVTRIEAGRIWLRNVYGDDTFGPLWVAPKALRFLEERWLIAGATIEERGRSRLAEVRGVYPIWAHGVTGR